jgi:hypothetical protein
MNCLEYFVPTAAVLAALLLGVVVGWLCWGRRGTWTPEDQLEHLRVMVDQDHRFLAFDKMADTLTTRYLAALEPDWYARVHVDA